MVETKKVFTMLWWLLLCVLVVWAMNFYATHTKMIVFCDVGQGAATLVQIHSVQVLIDTGPDARVLQCLGKHMPLFDTTIEYVIISHKQRDHNGGLFLLGPTYHVTTLISDAAYPKLPFVHTQITNMSSLSFPIDSSYFIVKRASESSNDINERAYVVTVHTPHDTIFLTSDISATELHALLPQDTTVLEVPHHGSRYGLYANSLGLAHPALAVISVGKKNSYGHPAPSVLAILRAKKIPVWRTDEKGEYVRVFN
jgi:competence protein ComEC